MYYGQSALNVPTDELIYKTNTTISQAIVTNFESKNGTSSSGVYAEEKLGKMDSYDVFLSGSTPLITINNPSNSTGKELIIFRDSYASSLAPLLLEEYSKITLVDLRYMSQELLTEYINFDQQDVLFLYSTLVINHSNLLK